MLRLTKLTDYGIALMTHVARSYTDQNFTANGIASETSLPLPTVSKLLKQLSRSELLHSQRGANGGYRLARAAEDISIVDLVSALEGPVAITECTTTTDSVCGLAESCTLRGHWHIINQRIVATLDEVSLAELAEAAPGAADLPMVSSR